MTLRLVADKQGDRFIFTIFWVKAFKHLKTLSADISTQHPINRIQIYLNWKNSEWWPMDKLIPERQLIQFLNNWFLLASFWMVANNSLMDLVSLTKFLTDDWHIHQFVHLHKKGRHRWSQRQHITLITQMHCFSKILAVFILYQDS